MIRLDKFVDPWAGLVQHFMFEREQAKVRFFVGKIHWLPGSLAMGKETLLVWAIHDEQTVVFQYPPPFR